MKCLHSVVYYLTFENIKDSIRLDKRKYNSMSFLHEIEAPSAESPAKSKSSRYISKWNL